MEDTEEFTGGLISFVRTQLGISIAQLSADLDMSYQNLWDIEKGTRGISNTRLNLLIQKLGMTTLQFYSYAPQYLEQIKNQQPLTNH